MLVFGFGRYLRTMVVVVGLALMVVGAVHDYRDTGFTAGTSSIDP